MYSVLSRVGAISLATDDQGQYLHFLLRAKYSKLTIEIVKDPTFSRILCHSLAIFYKFNS